jgi:thiamine biosynthesis lipoprotein
MLESKECGPGEAPTTRKAAVGEPGRLVIVGTPIGNLGDMTPRALEALRGADVVCAEDTRVTGKLLAAFGIATHLERCDENVIAQRSAGLVERIQAGEVVAFCSDAGMPCVSDPGSRLVAACREADVSIEVIPGASAVTCALAASGFLTTAFYFGGFLPRKAQARTHLLASLAPLEAVLIFYESPHRTLSSLESIATVFPARTVCMARELTKLHEEVLRAKASELVEMLEVREGSLRGEVVLLVGPPAEGEDPERHDPVDIDGRIGELLSQGLARSVVAKQLAGELGVSKNMLYDQVNALASRDTPPSGLGTQACDARTSTAQAYDVPVPANPPSVPQMVAPTAVGLNTIQFFAFDTIITISAQCDDSLLAMMEPRCIRYEKLLSRTIATSDVSRINDAHGATVEVDPDTAQLIKTSLAYCEESEGRFDITMGTVTPLWDFKKHIKPDGTSLAVALAHVDYRNVHVEGDTVTLEDPRARLDLGGIAKGWIADGLAAQLRAGGCESALINLGGNVMAVGGKPDGSPWNVGIQDPADPAAHTVMGLVGARNMSVVTSGLYERNFVASDGTVCHHILDRATGMPVKTDLLGATIVSRRSIDGDGFSTTLFLLGAQEALAFVEAHEGIEAVLVDDKRNVITSSGMGVTIPFARLNRTV